jgi:uncharacterized protein YjbI with pentapeptide repeats
VLWLRRAALGRAALGHATMGHAALGRAALGPATMGHAALGRAALGRAALVLRTFLGLAASLSGPAAQLRSPESPPRSMMVIFLPGFRLQDLKSVPTHAE